MRNNKESKEWTSHPLRFLDVQDLVILSFFGRGYTTAEITELLGCTSSSITYRKIKYHKLWKKEGFKLTFSREKGKEKHYVLNDFAQHMCQQSTKALEILGG